HRSELRVLPSQAPQSIQAPSDQLVSDMRSNEGSRSPGSDEVEEAVWIHLLPHPQSEAIPKDIPEHARTWNQPQTLTFRSQTDGTQENQTPQEDRNSTRLTS